MLGLNKIFQKLKITSKLLAEKAGSASGTSSDELQTMKFKLRISPHELVVLESRPKSC